jgi:hypothetical protein
VIYRPAYETTLGVIALDRLGNGTAADNGESNDASSKKFHDGPPD